MSYPRHTQYHPARGSWSKEQDRYNRRSEGVSVAIFFISKTEPLVFTPRIYHTDSMNSCAAKICLAACKNKAPQAMTWLRLRLSATLFVVQGRHSSLLGARAFTACSHGGQIVGSARSNRHRATNNALTSLRRVRRMATSASSAGVGPPDDGKSTSSTSKGNRLAGETSPYLLQHAHNPVDWMPWGKEAFQKAKAEDKPIFLSVGYSTCHW